MEGQLKDIVKLGSRSKVYLKSLIRDLDLELVAIIAMSPLLEKGKGPRVPRSKGPKDQDMSNSHSNTSLTLKKVHLVY